MLGDEDKRAHYDRFGEAAADLPFGGGADIQSATDFFDAIFGDLFGLGRKKAAGQDLRYTLELDFAEAALGCERSIRFTRQEDCGDCSGTGAEGGAAGLLPCKNCDGQGFIRQRTGFFASPARVPGLRRRRRGARACAAPAAPAPAWSSASGTTWCGCRRGRCRAAPSGWRARARPAGAGGPAGDLYVSVRVRPHEFYREEAGLLVCELPVSPAEAALGAEVEVPLLDARGAHAGAARHPVGHGVPAARQGLAAARPGCRAGTPTCGWWSRRRWPWPARPASLLEKAEAALRPDALPRRRAFRNLVASRHPTGGAGRGPVEAMRHSDEQRAKHTTTCRRPSRLWLHAAAVRGDVPDHHRGRAPSRPTRACRCPLQNGFAFSVPLMAILTCHEFGHYFAARLHGVPASLPVFHPAAA